MRLWERNLHSSLIYVSKLKIERLLNQTLEGLKEECLMVKLASVENHVNQTYEDHKNVDVWGVFVVLLALP